MKKRKIGNLFILSGLLLVAGAFLLTFWNMYDSRRAGEAADSVREELAAHIGAEEAQEADGEGASDSVTDPAVLTGITEDSLLPGEEPPMESYTYVVDGYPYIGILDVPDLGISLPVMADWNYERLRTSPCRYSGTPYNNDLVIAGHNYPSHFSPLKWVAIGTNVYFTTMDGVQFHYIVSNRETLQPYSVAEMVENDNNSDSTRDWDLTLFTCNTGGQTRCAVRCVRAEEG